MAATHFPSLQKTALIWGGLTKKIENSDESYENIHKVKQYISKLFKSLLKRLFRSGYDVKLKQYRRHCLQSASRRLGAEQQILAASSSIMSMVGEYVLLPAIAAKNARGLKAVGKPYANMRRQPAEEKSQADAVCMQIFRVPFWHRSTIPSPAQQRYQYFQKKQRTRLPRLFSERGVDPRLESAFERMLSLDFEDGHYIKRLDGLPCRAFCDDIHTLDVTTAKALVKVDSREACKCYKDSRFYLRNPKPSRLDWKTSLLQRYSCNDKFVTGVWADLLQNQCTQFPLSTVLVRWQENKRNGYTMEQLYEIFSAFGNVTCIALKSSTSAWIVFEELAHACLVMSYWKLGRDDNPIIPAWWHTHMNNKSFARSLTTDGLQIKISKNSTLRDYRL